MREDMVKQALDANLTGLGVTAANKQAVLDRVWDTQAPKR